MPISRVDSRMLETARKCGFFRLPSYVADDEIYVPILCLSKESFDDLKPSSDYYVITSKNPYPAFGRFARVFRICFIAKSRIRYVAGVVSGLYDALRPANFDPSVWERN